MNGTVADEMAAMLVAAGVRRVYGAEGSNSSVLHEALARRDELQCIGGLHEHSAAFAAVGEAQLSGATAVCCGGGGAASWQLAEGLYEAGSSKSPVLALAPVSHAYQGTHPEQALRDCSCYCELAHTPGQAGQVLSVAWRHAWAERSASVAMLPAEVAAAPAPMCGASSFSTAVHGVVEPTTEAVARLAELVNQSSRVVFLCGRGCAGAHDVLVELATRLGAPVAYTLCGKEVMEKENPCAVGMLGLLGWGDAPAVVQAADLLVIWGADFPYAGYLPTHGNVVQVDTDATALGRRVQLCHAVHGDVGRTAALLLPLLHGLRGEDFLLRSQMRHGRAVAEMESAVRIVHEHEPIRPEYITRLISCQAEPDAVFAVDVGPPLVWAARYLHALGHRRFIGAFHYGATGAALSMALGAKAACPSRQVIALCCACNLCHLVTELRVLRQHGLSVKVFVYNDSPPVANAMHGETPAPLAHDVAAVAAGAGVYAQRLTRAVDAAAAIRRWLSARGPALLDAALDTHALAAPPDSVLLRTLQHFNASTPPARRCELDDVRRLLFGNHKFYTHPMVAQHASQEVGNDK